MSQPTPAPHLGAITLFVRDRDEAARWYGILFHELIGTAEPIWQDDVSVVFRLGPTMVNLLHVSAGDAFIAPDVVADADAPIRSVATIDVEDVDATVDGLRAAGIAPSLPPVTRPWGPRTANLRDPFGHVWELATQAE